METHAADEQSNPATCADGMRAWIDRFLSDDAVRFCAGRSKLPKQEVRQILTTYGNEAAFYAPLAAAHAPASGRSLEVGSGLGFVSRWLRRHGYDIIALEPATGRFSAFGQLAEAIADIDGPPDPQGLAIGADALRRSEHGRFDFICSFNVLEHMADLPHAFSAMADVLAPGGRMVHVCPNYAFPYEPHLGIPLVPLRPDLTDRLFPGAVRRDLETWKTLNFVTARTLKALARREGLTIAFEASQINAYVDRLDSDEAFRKRHTSGNGLLAVGLRAAHGLRLLGQLRRLPPTLLSPMTVLLKAPKDGRDRGCT